MERGTIVRASAGRDSDGLFVVLGASDNKILIADGKRRPLERPKAKNPKHITPTDNALSEDEMKTNRMIRRTLRSIASSCILPPASCI